MKLPFKTIDLTHTLMPEIPTWNGSCGFRHELKQDYGVDETNPKFKVQQLKMHAGIGTHIDAPAHCIPGGIDVATLDLENLIAPCIVIDVSNRADQNYSVTEADIDAFEVLHGPIPPESFVIIYTGWDQHWHTPDKYRNDYHFPSISKAAALALLNRDIVGLGIDTLSPDRPDSGYPAHHLILGAGKYIVENVANASLMPPIGAHSLALPIKTQEGAEAPIRLVGLVPETIHLSEEKMRLLLDIGDEISEPELDLSHQAYDLLRERKVVAVRILFQTKKELRIEFEDGTSLMVDNFSSKQDITITT